MLAPMTIACLPRCTILPILSYPHVAAPPRRLLVQKSIVGRLSGLCEPAHSQERKSPCCSAKRRIC